jgi:hypothetical protein
MRKKGSRRNNATFEDYFGFPLPAAACLPEFRQEFSSLPAKVSRENSRTSKRSDNIEVHGCHSQKQMDSALSPDIDDISTCSEVIERWPEPASPSLTDSSMLKTNTADSRVHNDRSPRRPGVIESDPSETSSQCSLTSGSSTGRASFFRKASLFRRASQKEVGDKIGKTSHRVSASVWLANDFPVPLQQFLPVLEALSNEHEAMRRLKDLLSSQGFKDAAERARIAAESSGKVSSKGHIFPVKVSVPLNLAVRAVVHFEAFQVKKPGTFSPDIFKVPAGYTFASRKEAQKTTSRSRKRMLMAQLAL